MFDFNLLPTEVIEKIREYADPKTKMVLSRANKHIHEIGLSITRSLRVFALYIPGSKYYPSDIPKDILEKIICRYSMLTKITFGPQKNWSDSGEFQTKQISYLESLITYFQNNSEKHPLNSVKKIEFKEINNYCKSCTKIKTKELNKLFLSSLCHQRLENIRVTAYEQGSVLTEAEVQPVLTNSPNLKTFVFNGFQSHPIVSLSFADQSELSKVKLLHWQGSSSTIESLKTCTKLQELVINYGMYSNEVKEVLLKEHSWNLKRLELEGITIQNDAELDALTKNFPNLECLHIKLQGISDNGMELLGKNCSNLKILQFSNRYLTDCGLSRLTKHLPNLETISFDVAYNITEVGIEAMSENCKNLRFIRIIHYKKIEKSGIEALVKNCLNLVALEFSHGGPVSLEDMDDLVQKIKSLRYLELYRIRGVEEEQIVEFYKKHPQIRKKISYAISAKKLHKLTI